MKHRKLRIAWSVAWGVVAVLLCVLWVRSYWYHDICEWMPSRYFSIGLTSAAGRVHGFEMRNVDFGEAESYFRSEPIEDWEEARAAQEIDLSWEPWGNGESSGQLPVYGGFAIGRTPTDWAILMPHWFSVLVVGGIGTVPWLRFRFSLRTLLIATTLVAVVLGLIVWAIR